MTQTRKILLVTSTQRPAKAGPALDVTKLEAALRARGAEVEALELDADPATLLDHLAAGAVPVVLRGDRGA
ncbi:MAG: hypothetical protein K8I04_04035 [Gammaproteobacteria bacterium]|nr:hypothetical protein [Gammaproteobacteria bacterium]